MHPISKGFMIATAVATMAIGASGAVNAGLLAVAILGTSRADLRTKLQAYRDEMAAEVRRSSLT